MEKEGFNVAFVSSVLCQTSRTPVFWGSGVERALEPALVRLWGPRVPALLAKHFCFVLQFVQENGCV